MTLFSVIIPVYNSVVYLVRCLDSVVNNDNKDCEVIIVDDGSTDGSSIVCDIFASRYSNITVYHKNNEGASLARKFGLERAKGKYITFIDSDDWVSNDYISKLYSLIEEYDVSVSACAVRRVKVGETPEVSDRKYKSTCLAFEELMHRFFKYEFWGFPGKLYLRSSLVNLDFPHATIGEDYYVMSQLFNNERQIAYTDEPLYYYEYHEESLSHQKLSKKAFEEFENVRAVYNNTKKFLPKYSNYALSNVVETCVKLNTLTNRNNNYCHEELVSTISFLRSHMIHILLCRPMNIKVKFLSLILSFFPCVFYRINEHRQ